MIFAFLFCRSVLASRGLKRLLAMAAVALLLAGNVYAAISVGAKVTFYATADGTPAPTFQWKKNGSNIPGATGATFVIAAATLADAGTYRVTASNVAGSADSADEILVIEGAPNPTTVAPYFTLQPVTTLNLVAGATATISVAAAGTPVPTYQWQKNGVAIAGATNATLVIEGVATSDSGTYVAVATNAGGSAPSGAAQLSVTPPVVVPPPPVNVAPTITSQPAASQSVGTGATVNFTVAATGTPAPTYQWNKNSVAIAGATSPTLTLAGVTVEDSASYSVIVTNTVGSVASSSAVLAVIPPVVVPPPPPPSPVNVAPTITSQPVASQSVGAGATVNFSVAATGMPVPTYQWNKGSVAIAGATNHTLTLAGVTVEDSATYSVIVTNTVGSVASSPAVLAVIPPVVVPPPPPTPVNVAPTFTSQPAASQTVGTGATVNFTAAATGTPSPTYLWHQNGVAITGATNSTLTLVGVTTADNATYSVTATNAAGSVTSSPAVLSVTPPVVTPPPPPPTPVSVAPVIASQPTSNQTVPTGGTVTLTVTATGTPAPEFQWQKNDLAVPGATNATLVLTGVAAADAGTYVVIVSNLAGSVGSSPAVVVVSAPVVTPPPPVAPPPATPPPGSPPPVAPAITNQPVASQSIVAGTEVTLSVTASGSPAPAYQWRKNGISILGATGSTLVLRNTTATDAATYSVVASNSAGTVQSANAVVAVGVRPVFTVEPESQGINLGARVTLRAVVVGMPTPTLQWFKNGTALPGATTAILLLNATTANDLATYKVAATNSLGTTTSREAAIVIAAPPIITAQPTSQTVPARSSVTFSVTATGSPAPTYQWKKNGVNLPGATGARLTLANVGTADEGAYSVEVSNSVGWIPSNRATLNVSAAVEQRQADSSGTTGSPDTAATSASTASRIVNLSVRSRAGSGDNGLIVGFVIGGSASKPMLLRGVGPALTGFGVSDALVDPTLSLYSGAVMKASNDDWATDGNASQIVQTSARLGAFSLPDASGDSAMMANLDTGAYTVQLNGKDTATGVALVEVYDAAATNPANLINLSVRTNVGAGADAPNVGFVVSGTAAKRVLIRAVGPTLAAFGVPDVLADPELQIFKGGELLEANDNWGGDPALAATFARIGAFGLADGNSKDAVLLVTLQPGAYTVVASGVNSSTGIALVEVYDVP